MSELFRVQVLHIVRDTVTLQLVIVHPDQRYFYATKSFALQLIWEPVYVSYEFEGNTVCVHEANALGAAVSVENIQDAHFMITHQDRFITSVEIVETANYPVQVAFDTLSDSEFEAYWKDLTHLPQAVLKITVIEPKWIAHLKAGMAWDSTAYNMEP
jgi:hypothetical protein